MTRVIGQAEFIPSEGTLWQRCAYSNHWRTAPLFQAVHTHAVLPKLRIAQVDLVGTQVRHLLAPIAVGRTASDNKIHEQW